MNSFSTPARTLIRVACFQIVLFISIGSWAQHRIEGQVRASDTHEPLNFLPLQMCY